MNLSENVARVRADIAKYAPDRQVTLVAVTKTHSAQEINPLYDLGVRDIGENRVQEWVEKRDFVRGEFMLHQIGHLQSNKVKYLLPRVKMIHSVDRLSLLSQIGELAHRQDLCVDILLQVNTARESQKGGVLPEKLFELAEAAMQTPGVHLRGLMCMAPLADNAQLDGAKDAFSQAKALFDQASARFGAQIDTLSMGMSRDYCMALACGATMIRVGHSLFQ